MARDIYHQNGVQEFKLKLIANRSIDGRQNNLLTCSIVAALLVEQCSHEESHCDIIVEHKINGLQRITELHPSLMSLQYPLLFPYGEDDYRLGISHQNPTTGKCYKRQTITMRQYYAFHLQQCLGEAQTLLRGGRLFQQYLVDVYACIEEVRINWIHKNQKQLRFELYCGLRDGLNQGYVMTDSIGKMTILPSTYTGGPRYRVQNYQQTIYFPKEMRVNTILNRSGIETTMFTEWMRMNVKDTEAQQLTYSEFPTKFFWNKRNKKWTKRLSGRCVGRIYYVPPTTREKYYLHMLLSIIRGSCSYEEIKTVDGVLYDTFKEACYDLDLLVDDKEWDDCIKEAANWGSGLQLRQLFSTILLHCEVLNPSQLWISNWKLLSEDILYRQRRILNFTTLEISDEQLQNYALLEIEKMLRKAGKSLEDYHGMSTLDSSLLEEMRNRLISEELNHDRLKMQEEYSKLFSGLNSDQKTIHDILLQSINLSLGKLFFVYGSGGTWKTYLWRTLLAKVRLEGKIAIAVATSGIAALLLPVGRTAHSRFHIPLNPTKESTCDIKKTHNLLN